MKTTQRVTGRAVLLLLCLTVGAAAQVNLVVSQRPEAVVVAAQDESSQFAATELQKYFELLTGARLEIVTSDEARRRPASINWVLVGGPQANDLVRKAASRNQVSFDKLKTDGFILKTIHLEGRNTLVAGGNDEASTIYAVYDLLERCGAVFLLTGDIIPSKKPTLALASLDVRSEPAFPRRGLNDWFGYENTSVMSMADMRTFLDQMQKMKFNYLQFGWLAYEPWLKYDYHGEAKWVGDVTDKESGYHLWSHGGFGRHLTSEMTVGQEHFKAAGVYPRLVSPEFQHIENSEQAFELHEKYLHEVIAYATKRHIKVWLQIDATAVAANLARYTTQSPIFSAGLLGFFMCPNNPLSWELNESRFKSLVQTYPEVEGYSLYLPESYPVCYQTAEDRSLYESLRPKFPREPEAMTKFTGRAEKDARVALDSNSGSVYIIQKLLEAKSRIAPKTLVGIAGIGRLYLFPDLDTMVPPDVPFTDFESRGVWTPTGVPMEMFATTNGRERTLVNRIDDDGSMLGMQFNVNLYDKDQVLEGALKYGLAGFASQVSRARGTETNSKYMAEGEWNPHLKPDEFYQKYAKNIFGERSLPHMLRAFASLEKNEEYLEWRGFKNFGCCAPPEELSTAYTYYKQPLPFDGPKFAGWQLFIKGLPEQMKYFAGGTKLLQEALDELRKARPEADSGSKAYLDYLINRTEAYILHLETKIVWDQAFLDFDRAFRTNSEGSDRQEFVRQLDKSLDEFKQAHDKAEALAQKWSEIVDHPSDLGVLYRINVFMVDGTDLTSRLMQNVDLYYHGHDFAQPVPFEKIFVPWPNLNTSGMN